MLDALNVFQTETDLDAAPPAPRAHDGVSVAELQAKSIELEWYEAVAISQALCDALRAAGDDHGPVRIDANGVFIDAAGNLEVIPKRRLDGQTALEQAADFLRSLLPEQNVPTPLRLAISQAAISDSMEAWSKTIAYYERPNRPAIIQAVYDRARSVSASVTPAVSTSSEYPSHSTPVAPHSAPAKAAAGTDATSSAHDYAPAAPPEVAPQTEVAPIQEVAPPATIADTTKLRAELLRRPRAVPTFRNIGRRLSNNAKNILVISGAVVFGMLAASTLWIMKGELQQDPAPADQSEARSVSKRESGVAAPAPDSSDEAESKIASPGVEPSVVPATAIGRETTVLHGSDWITLAPETPLLPPAAAPAHLPPTPAPPLRRPSTQIARSSVPASISIPSPIPAPAPLTPPTPLRSEGSAAASTVLSTVATTPAPVRNHAGLWFPPYPAVSTIYSQTDTDVVPPRAIYPHFPSSLPPGATPNQIAELEVVVTETGGVESVKARRLPLSMAETMKVVMNLSAAKAWRFSPGVKDGQPVKYRKIIWMLNN